VINDYIVHALEVCLGKVYIFGRIQTLETVARYNRIFRDTPPSMVCPFVKRIPCYRSDESKQSKGSAVCYAWFIWDNQDDDNECRIKWLI